MKKQDKHTIETELIYGTHPVLEVLQQKRRKVFEIFALESDTVMLKKIQALLPKYPVTIHKMQRDTLSRKLNTTDHQGLGALVGAYPYRKKFFDAKAQPFLIMLDGIQDVRNLGAVIRSAYCTGVDGIILCKKKSATLTATALKASAGLAERIEIYQAPSIEHALIDLKNSGYNLYVTALSKNANAYSLSYQGPLCLVIGSEGYGVSSASLAAGTVVTLPQKTSDISYNASVAAGIIMSLIAFGKR